MQKPLDRITEAYFDQMGSTFGYKVRTRIHWICENALGDTVLDVGCSQGITSILLGRESKQVLGIDLLQESIDYANNLLMDEAEITKKYVEFKTANFIDYDFGDHKFDSIIFGEVLEHITDPNRFMKKAVELLQEDGQIIITVPFGINDYFDHKKTYYLYEILKLQTNNLKIKDIKFFGEWIGAVFGKGQNHDSGILDLNLLSILEDNFYNLERDLVNDLKEKNASMQDLEQLTNEKKQYKREMTEKNEELEQLTLKLSHLESNMADKQIASTAEKISDKVSKKDEQIKKLTQEVKKYKNLENQYKNKILELNREVILEKRQKVKSDELLLESYTKEERLLKTYAQLLKRYEALKNSKLGRLTIKYWQWRRKRFGGR